MELCCWEGKGPITELLSVTWYDHLSLTCVMCAANWHHPTRAEYFAKPHLTSVREQQDEWVNPKIIQVQDALVVQDTRYFNSLSLPHGVCDMCATNTYSCTCTHTCIWLLQRSL